MLPNSLEYSGHRKLRQSNSPFKFVYLNIFSNKLSDCYHNWPVSESFIPANSDTLGVSLTPAGWKLQSHASSCLRANFSHLIEKMWIVAVFLDTISKNMLTQTQVRDKNHTCKMNRWQYLPRDLWSLKWKALGASSRLYPSYLRLGLRNARAVPAFVTICKFCKKNTLKD